ncbi:MAG: ribosome-associated translation inhibitor RaiA [Cyanobacteria bacterium P01_H01_bin.74]
MNQVGKKSVQSVIIGENKLMKLIVNGRNIELTDAIKSHVTDKLRRLNQHYDFINELHVFLSVEKNPRIAENQVAEATILVNKAVFRVTVTSDDLYGSVDALHDKIDRVLQRHKTKSLGRSKSAKAGTLRKEQGFLAEESNEEIARGFEDDFYTAYDVNAALEEDDLPMVSEGYAS